MAITQIADVIVPEVFGPYIQQYTETKSNLITSGAIEVDPQLSMMLAGGGLTFNVPSWLDLDDSDLNVGDDSATLATAAKTTAAEEVMVRLSRNKTFAYSDLTGILAGSDPAASIGNRVGEYFTRKLQDAFIATTKGVFADNAAAPSATEHVQNDLTYNISGGAFVDGVTNFSTEAFIDALTTAGDSADNITIVMVHSVVYARMQKNNLLEFVADSVNPDAAKIPFFLGRRVIVNDKMPVTAGVYDTWLFGAGAFKLGSVMPMNATETYREPLAGNGQGQETLIQRVQWMLHPLGHKYVGTAPNGGPSDAATSNNLAHAGSWQRAYSQRKQIKIARLITREA